MTFCGYYWSFGSTEITLDILSSSKRFIGIILVADDILKLYVSDCHLLLILLTPRIYNCNVSLPCILGILYFTIVILILWFVIPTFDIIWCMDSPSPLSCFFKIFLLLYMLVWLSIQDSGIIVIPNQSIDIHTSKHWHLSELVITMVWKLKDLVEGVITVRFSLWLVSIAYSLTALVIMYR